MTHPLDGLADFLWAQLNADELDARADGADDPAFVLADLAAKKTIVEEFASFPAAPRGAVVDNPNARAAVPDPRRMARRVDRMRHRHQWEPVSANFSAPSGRLTQVTGYDDGTLLACEYGLTTVTQRCVRCGRVESYTTPGQADLGDRQ